MKGKRKVEGEDESREQQEEALKDGRGKYRGQVVASKLSASKLLKRHPI